MKWNLLYYEDKHGKCPTLDFINACSLREKAKLTNWLSLLEEKGPHLPRPFADILENGIHELRIKLKGNQVRIFYFFCFGDIIVLTHSIVKNTDKVPKKEINKAKKYREDFLKRYTEAELRRFLNENI